MLKRVQDQFPTFGQKMTYFLGRLPIIYPFYRDFMLKVGGE